MSNRPEELIHRHFLDQFSKKTQRYVGVEIEMPVVNLEKQPVSPEFVTAMTKLLTDWFGFKPTSYSQEGIPIKAVNDHGDVFSFETSWNTIEFSLRQAKSIHTIANRFYAYIKALQSLGKGYRHLICGMGTNPYAQFADSRPLNTPIMLAKAEFLKRFTTHHNGEIFHAFSASTQTHLDTGLSQLPSALNLLGKLGFVDALLFANSLPFDDAETPWRLRLPASVQLKMQTPTLCFRDTLWRLCEAPNTTAFDGTYTSVQEIAAHLMGLKLFIANDGNGGFKPMSPLSFSNYFMDGSKPEEDVACFRSLEPIAVSGHGTIEVRQTCTQPLSMTFAPVAFYAGLMENQQEALELADHFWQENRIEAAPSQLRYQAVHQDPIAPQTNVSAFVANLVMASQKGLRQRGLGEEKFLEGLIQSDGSFECPAKRQLRWLMDGLTGEEIMHAYSQVCDAVGGGSDGISIQTSHYPF